MLSRNLVHPACRPERFGFRAEGRREEGHALISMFRYASSAMILRVEYSNPRAFGRYSANDWHLVEQCNLAENA